MLLQFMLTPAQEAQLRKLKNLETELRAQSDSLLNSIIAAQEFPLIMGRPVCKFKPSAAQKTELSYIGATFGGTYSSEYIKRYAEMEQAFQKYATAYKVYVARCKDIKAAWILELTAKLGELKNGRMPSKQEIVSEALDHGLAVILKRYTENQSSKDRLKGIKASLAAVNPPEFPEPPKNTGDVTMTLEELQRKYAPKKRFS